ncbi:MAG: flagellar basal body-associated FliL family protein [Actinobacteria bacterium]|nr:flagellar basal body-associated FliL family protein [Actinomycetota bacterium]
MSDADNEATEAAQDGGNAKSSKKGKKGGGKSNLVPAIVLALGLLGGGYFMGSGGTAEAGESPSTTEPIVLGEIATMEAININLADGHFLRVGLALQLIEGVEKSEFEKGETAKANDLLISNLGGRPMAELARAEGREQIKTHLKEQMKEVYEGDVVDVFFTDFVMQ